jgi:DNA-binding XRE family transcriptional regulator
VLQSWSAFRSTWNDGLGKKSDETRARWNRAVAAVLSGARDDADLKQEDVAAALGVHRNLVGRIETSKREMTIADLAVFADLTGQSPTDLFELIVKWASKLK